jgi:hypothetical protein
LARQTWVITGAATRFFHSSVINVLAGFSLDLVSVVSLLSWSRMSVAGHQVVRLVCYDMASLGIGRSSSPMSLDL